MNSIIEVKNVTYEYSDEDNTFAAVKNLSLNIERGSFTVILGHNGSGKSTLLKAVMGLVPIEKGSVSTPLSPDEISYLPQQNPVEKCFPATVREVVLTGTQKSGRKLCTFYSKEDKMLADRAIETMGIGANA